LLHRGLETRQRLFEEDATSKLERRDRLCAIALLRVLLEQTVHLL